MCPCPIPVPFYRLRVQTDNHPKLLGDSLQDVPGDPQVIAYAHPDTGTHLELPLRRHHLCVCATDLHSGVQAGLVVRLHNVAAKHLVSADAAIIRSLWPREAALWLAERLLVKVKQRVLLLDAEPRLLGLHLGSGLGARVAPIRLAGRVIELEGLAHDQDVVAALERVPVDGHGMQVRVRVVASRLARGAAVIVPDGQVCWMAVWLVTLFNLGRRLRGWVECGN